MRRNIGIDGKLRKQVARTTGDQAEKTAVDAGLQLKLEGQKKILALVGRVQWEGDLEQSRLGRFDAQSTVRNRGGFSSYKL